MALLSPETAHEIAGLDDKTHCLLEDVNKVSRLDLLANTILPPTALAWFSAAITKNRMKIRDYTVQAPVGSMSEARLYLRNNRNHDAVRHRITPSTTSTGGVLSSAPGEESNNISMEDPFFYFVRSVAGQPSGPHPNPLPESPSLPLRPFFYSAAPISFLVGMDTDGERTSTCQRVHDDVVPRVL